MNKQFRNHLVVCAVAVFIFMVATVPAFSQTVSTNKAEKINITFDEKNPSIMIVEADGERVRVDTVTKKIERLTDPPAVALAQTTAKSVPAASKGDDKDDLYVYEAGDEPFDYRLINVPTPKKVPKGTWNLNFSHRFSQPVDPLSESAKTLLGLDSFSASAFGIMYGITDKFYINASRSPICQRGLCRTIEIGFGYHFTDQNEKSPVALSAYSSVEGDENFSKQYTYNFQTMISRRFGRRVFAFFAPAVHLNSNHGRRFDPKPTDYFPTANIALNFNQPVNGASFGFGTQVRITPSVSATFEFTPRTGFKLGRVQSILGPNFSISGFKTVSEPEMGIGLMYSIGKHKFSLTFSNTQTTTTSRYNSSNLVLSPKQLVIGFNLFRRW